MFQFKFWPIGSPRVGPKSSSLIVSTQLILESNKLVQSYIPTAGHCCGLGVINGMSCTFPVLGFRSLSLLPVKSSSVGPNLYLKAAPPSNKSHGPFCSTMNPFLCGGGPMWTSAMHWSIILCSWPEMPEALAEVFWVQGRETRNIVMYYWDGGPSIPHEWVFSTL